jgi:hypothetical protein
MTNTASETPERTNVVDPVTEAECKTLADALDGIITANIEVSTIVTGYVTREPNFPERFAAENPRFGAQSIWRLHDIGRGAMIPELSMHDGPGITGLRRCAIGLQRLHLETPIRVAERKDDGSIDFRLVLARHMTANHARLVFAKIEGASGGSYIRSDEEQTAILTKPIEPEPQIGPDWSIQGKTCRVVRSTVIASHEVASIARALMTAAQIEAMLKALPSDTRAEILENMDGY